MESHVGANQEWPFDQEPNVAALTTKQVLEGLPILYVTHYEDDHSWSFVHGTGEDYDKDGRLICMAEALELDASIREVADLPPGWYAWREDKHSEWQRAADDAA